MFLAVLIWPWCGLTLWTLSSIAQVIPFKASIVRQYAISAVLSKFIASYVAKSPIAVITCVPFISAKPSFEDKLSIMLIPDFSIAHLEGILSPLYIASPSPIIVKTIWDKGAKSPDAPSEPFSGIIGCTPLFIISTKVCNVSNLIPEYPLAKLFTLSNIIALTVSSLKGLPTPQEWLIIKFSWSSLESSLDIATSENLPNPVVIPYEIFPSSTSLSTNSLDFFTFIIASSVIITS